MHPQNHLACILLILLPLATHAQPQATQRACETAVNATIFAAKLVAAASNSTLPNSVSASSLTPPTPDLVARYLAAVTDTRESLAARSTNLAQFFPDTTSPYHGWGDRLLQTALGQALHVPAATLGEMVMVANTLQRSRGQAPSPTTLESTWRGAWDQLIDRLVAESANNTDAYSQRSLLLRSMVYSFVSLAATTPGPAAHQVYEDAKERFQEARTLFGAYEFYNMTYSYTNGSTTGVYDALLVTPAATNAPLMIIFGSPFNWKEITFLRYGLGALRRGYAVVVMDLPGQVSTLSQPPHQPISYNYSSIATNLLDAVDRVLGEDEDAVDTSSVTIMAVTLSAAGAANACAGLGRRVRACVLNPGIANLASLAVTVVTGAFYNPLAAVANTTPEAFPTQSLANAFKVPAVSIVAPLLLNCSATSGAPEALAALANARGGYDPELGWAIASLSGMQFPATHEQVNNHAWTAFSNIARQPPMALGNITAPVLVVSSAEDWTMGGQDSLVQAGLTNAAKVQVVQLGAETGAASAAQIGAGVVFEQVVFPWLMKTL